MELVDITLRDAQQCLWATRMTTAEMTPIARTMDDAGFSMIDLTGGAAIDSSIMYLGEDPFERIRTMSKLMPKTPLNFNTRGQSIFRWTQYADDVAEFTLELMRRNGIRSIMAFDSLNDIRNLAFSIRAGKTLGMNVIGAVSYTISPVHTDDHFVGKAKELVSLGVDAVEIKDQGGILTPERARQLIPKIRLAVGGKAQLQLHSHGTFGHGIDSYLEAMKLGENGVDLLHGASRPLAYGYSLPAHDDILNGLSDQGYTTPVSRDAVEEMHAYFSAITRQSGRQEGKVIPIQSESIAHQVPGGMLSNLKQQLDDQGQGHRLPEVLDEITRVREDIGFPIIVSPMAQYLAIQAVMNVLTGKRYQIVPQEIKQYVLGYYGAVPGPIDPKARELIAGDEQGIAVAPGTLIEPMMDRYRREFAPYDSDEELALKIFYSAQDLEKNRAARLNVRKRSTVTDAAGFLAKQLLGNREIEVCEINRPDFHFSMKRDADVELTA
jgi:pyruvate/oxaloacetate carboxyltransferase